MPSFVTSASDQQADPSAPVQRRPVQTPLATWVKDSACAGKTVLFEDELRVNEALVLCSTCPVLRACQRWALINAVDGVAGGTTPKARRLWRAEHNVDEPTLSLEEFLPIGVVARDARYRRRGAELAAVLAAVAERTAKGEFAGDIADLLGVNRENVQRFRARAGVVGLHPMSRRRAAAS